MPRQTFSSSFTFTLLPHSKTLLSPNTTPSYSYVRIEEKQPRVNPKASSYTSPKATSKSPSSKQHNKPPRRPLLEPSFPTVIFNVLDNFINTFIDLPLHPSDDQKCVLSNNCAFVDELPPTEFEVVKGSLPPCLNGAYITNGPNPQYLPCGPFPLSDGDGMIHSIKISQGKASYCSCYVKTYKYLVENEVRFPVFPNIFSNFNRLTASVSCEAVSMVRAIIGQFVTTKGIGVASTSLALFGVKLFALCESDHPYAIKLASNGDIITIGRHDFDGNISSNMTAHPKIDQETLEAFAFHYSPISPF